MNNLTKAFQELRGTYHIVSRQNYTCCQTCGCDEMVDLAEKELAKGKAVNGMMFYHNQDHERKEEGQNFRLTYGNLDIDGQKVGFQTEAVGYIVVSVLSKHGVETEWNGDADERILVKTQSIRRLPGMYETRRLRQRLLE